MSKPVCRGTPSAAVPSPITMLRSADVVWIPQNFQNTILARYHDDVVKQGDRWLFRRREEFPVEHRPGPPPMSDTAMLVSSATMLGDG